VHAYLPQILRAARAGGLSEDEARDTTQSTFTTFIEKLPEFEGRSHIRTWLFGILYRKMQESYRARQRTQNLDDIEEVMEARFDARGHWIRPPRPVDLQMEDAEVRHSLEDCMDGLSENQRMAFVLREVQGYGTEEICKILSVTVTNLGVMMYRARNRLRECLEAKGVGGP
jgi:RNA polymerase sigma-70 factor (ECF subfamily)